MWVDSHNIRYLKKKRKVYKMNLSLSVLSHLKKWKVFVIQKGRLIKMVVKTKNWFSLTLAFVFFCQKNNNQSNTDNKIKVGLVLQEGSILTGL